MPTVASCLIEPSSVEAYSQPSDVRALYPISVLSAAYLSLAASVGKHSELYRQADSSSIDRPLRQQDR